MQFLGTKRTITISEKVLYSLVSHHRHHHHHRPKIDSSRSGNCITHSHAKWRRKPIPVRINDNEDDDRRWERNSSSGLFCSGLGFRATAATRTPSDHCKYVERRGNFGRGYRSSDGAGDRQQPSRSTKTDRGTVDEGHKNDEGHENDERRDYDAILVLAGGQVAGGGVPVWVERRLDKALDLQKRRRSKKRCKIVCLGGGTPHRAPVLSSGGFVVHESTSCVEFLHRRGAAFDDLIKEWASYDTIGNGYFSLTQHVIPRRWRTLAVVTSAFHMPRTRAVFEWIFGLHGAGLALQLQEEQGEGQGQAQLVTATGSKAQGFHLEFHSVPDQGDIDECIVQARLERERNSMKNLSVLSQRIHSLEDFHEWFHTEHKAYNTEDQHLFGNEDKDDPALQSY